MLRPKGTKRVNAYEVEKIHRKRQKLDLSAHFVIPQLDRTSPCAQLPDGMILPLYAFQKRSLYKMLQLEKNPEFKLKKKMQRTKGGVLADEVGLGKTATCVGLIVSDPRSREGYGNLVLTPTHLCYQWQQEIVKFSNLRSIIVRNTTDHASIKRFKNYDVIIVSLDYYKNTYSVSGDVSQTFHQVTWRRLILDECHEVVKGNENRCTNFINSLLSLKIENIWLVSGTPFPFGDKSVYAVNALLGIKIKIFVSNNPFSIAAHNSKVVHKYPLFENWKDRLCIRNTRQGLGSEWTSISQNSYDVNFKENNIFMDFTKVERAFYDVTRKQIPLDVRKNPFSDKFKRLRQLCCHPSVSSEFNNSFAKESGAYSLDDLQYRMVNLRKRQIIDIDIQNDQFREDIEAAWRTIKYINGEAYNKDENRYRWSQELMSASAPDIRYIGLGILKRKLRDESPDSKKQICKTHANFINKAENKIIGNREKKSQFEKDVKFFQGMIDDLNSEVVKEGGHSCTICTSTVKEISITECGHPFCVDCLQAWLGKKDTCPICRERVVRDKIVVVDMSKEKSDATTSKEVSDDPVVNAFGTKMASLLKMLQRLFTSEPTAKVIVFSQYHNCLKLIHQTLLKSKIANYFADERMSLETCILRFQTSQKVRTLLLSSTARAAGANLQVANHVIFVDPPGESIGDALMLEKQAIGRCVRAGQTREVTVTRMCFRNTIEENLMDLIQNRKGRNQAIQESSGSKSSKIKEEPMLVPPVLSKSIPVPPPVKSKNKKSNSPAALQALRGMGIETKEALQAIEKARKLYGKEPSVAQVVQVLFR